MKGQMKRKRRKATGIGNMVIRAQKNPLAMVRTRALTGTRVPSRPRKVAAAGEHPWGKGVPRGGRKQGQSPCFKRPLAPRRSEELRDVAAHAVSELIV